MKGYVFHDRPGEVSFADTATNDPIPADFFGPGSDPFTGTVYFTGSPVLNDSDEPLYPDSSVQMVVRRRFHGFIPTSNSGTSGSPEPPVSSLISTSLVSMSLASTAPITVTYGAGSPETWDVSAEASDTQWINGDIGITATRVHADGGTYEALTSASLLFTFTNTDTLAEVTYDQGDYLGDNPNGTDWTQLATTNGQWVEGAVLLAAIGGGQPELACVYEQAGWGTCDNSGWETEESNAFVPGVMSSAGTLSLVTDQLTEEDAEGAPKDRAKFAIRIAQDDTDGDNVGDCDDGCPTDPDKTDPGICGCGVADTDTDGDATPDCNDACPYEPALIAPDENPEVTCDDGIDNDCDGLTDGDDPDCQGPACICGDLDDSGGKVNLADFSKFSVCFGLKAPNTNCPQALFDCADLNQDGSINLTDFSTFSVLFGTISTNSPPNCP